MPNTNTRARARKKLKTLRSKQLKQRILDRQDRDRIKALRPKGTTIKGMEAAKVAKRVDPRTTKYLNDWAFKTKLNQRQRRKRARQTGRKLKH